MIDTDKYGDMTMDDRTAPLDRETLEYPQIPARWKVKLCWTDAYMVVGNEVICSLTGNKDSPNRKEWAELIADAPILLEEVKRLQRELDTQYEYIEWLEEFAPKAGEYNTAWDAYELAKGIHWTQMEEEE